MNAEEKKGILEKVQKLLALAAANANTTEHEAASAATKARELLDKYDLSMTELEHLEAEVVETPCDTGTRQPHYWMRRLAVVVCDAFNCKTFRYGGRMVMVGAKADTQIAQYLYAYLFRTIDRLYREYYQSLDRSGQLSMLQMRGVTRSYMQSYATGLVKGIDEKLRVHARSRERMATYRTVTGKDLVVVKNQALDKYWKTRTKGFRKGSRGSQKLHYGSFDDGVRDGKNVSIHTGVNGGESRRYIE